MYIESIYGGDMLQTLQTLLQLIQRHSRCINFSNSEVVLCVWEMRPKHIRFEIGVRSIITDLFECS